MADKPATPRVRAAGFQTLYVNATLMGITAWDIQIVLSKSIGIGEDRILEDQVAIYQSPTHAKAMLRGLEQTIAAYEAKHGQIPDVNKPDEETAKPVRKRVAAKQED